MWNIAQVQERGRKYSDAEQSRKRPSKWLATMATKETTWFMLGAIYEREKKFDLAEEQFRKALGVNPNNAAVLNYYGYMLADRGVRLEEATAMIQKAVALDPNNGAYLDSLRLGLLQAKQASGGGRKSAQSRGPAESRSHDPGPPGRRVHETGANQSRRQLLGARARGMAKSHPCGLRS